jgi:hypothetical protein
MKFSFKPRTEVGVYRAAVVVCILLIFLTAFIAAVHFHPDQSASDRSCSVCAMVHAGILPVELGPQVPIFVPSLVAEASAATARSLLLTSSYFIRPPPLA